MNPSQALYDHLNLTNLHIHETGGGGGSGGGAAATVTAYCNGL